MDPTSLSSSPQYQRSVKLAFEGLPPRQLTVAKPSVLTADSRRCEPFSFVRTEESGAEVNNINRVTKRRITAEAAATVIVSLLKCFGTDNIQGFWRLIVPLVETKLNLPPPEPEPCPDCRLVSSAATELLDACQPSSVEFRTIYSLFASAGASFPGLKKFFSNSGSSPGLFWNHFVD